MTSGRVCLSIPYAVRAQAHPLAPIRAHPRPSAGVAGRLRRGVRVGYTAGGRFSRLSHLGPVAQGIEQWFPKPCVGGSNPLGATLITPLEYSICALVTIR